MGKSSRAGNVTKFLLMYDVNTYKTRYDSNLKGQIITTLRDEAISMLIHYQDFVVNSNYIIAVYNSAEVLGAPSNPGYIEGVGKNIQIEVR